MRRSAGGLLGRAATLARDARGRLPGPALRRLVDARTVRGGARTGVVVDMPDARTVTVSRTEGSARVSRTRPPGPVARRGLGPGPDAGPPEEVRGRLLLTVPDPAALVRLASAGLLAGSVDALRVVVRWCPAWVRSGAPGVRPDAALTDLRVRVRGEGVEVSLAWSRPAGVSFALDAVLRVVLRTRTTPRHDGPLPALDRSGWEAGAWTWPDGVLLDERPAPASPGPGPLTPFADPVGYLAGADPAAGGPTLVTAVAFPWRRRLLGEPADYRLLRGGSGALTVTGRTAGERSVAVFDGVSGVERVVSGGRLVRYATAALADDALADGARTGAGGAGGADSPTVDRTVAGLDAVLLALAAVGVVTVPEGPLGRARLTGLGLPFPESAAEVHGTEGYAWSAAASRAAAIEADPVLRRALGSHAQAAPMIALPTVSVVIASMRPDTVAAVLADLAGQTWPDFEVVLGTHGWTAGPDDLERWSAMLARPVRAVAAAADTPFGEVLGRLSRMADGDLITKVDDDDVYGPDHLTDLVLARRTSGADLVSKAPRFVHLAAAGADPRDGHSGRTVDRSWAASEVLDTTPAGGTLLFARSTLLSAGGWSGSLRHVDIDVTARIRRAGGVTYRSHGLGYTYVRHEHGHTWDVDRALFLEQAGQVYDGLPAALAVGRPAALRRGLPGWAGVDA